MKSLFVVPALYLCKTLVMGRSHQAKGVEMLSLEIEYIQLCAVQITFYLLTHAV